MNKKSYGNFVERFIHRLLGSSYYSAKVANYIFERYAGEDRNIKNIINSLKPDLMIVFVRGNAALEIEAIKSAKLNKIPAMGLQSTWDSLSNRGLMPFPPDYMGVWGYQSSVVAEKMHKVPKERIFLAGAPFADEFKAPANKSESEIRARLGLPAGKRVLFFAGSIWAYNEVRNLKFIDNAIESKDLDNCCIFYRPHPFQHKSTGDLDFFAQNFKHVYLDPMLAQRYKIAKDKNKGFPFDKDRVPISFEHLKEVFVVSSIIIASLSTVMIQGAVYGVPSVGIGYVDKANKKYYKRIEFEELSIIKFIPGITLCPSPDKLIQYCLKALKYSEDELIVNTMKKYAAIAVHNDELTYSQRLQNAISAILYPDRYSVYNSLSEPIFDISKKQNVINFDKVVIASKTNRSDNGPK